MAYKALVRPRLEYCAIVFVTHIGYSSRSIEVGGDAEASGQICHETLPQHQQRIRHDGTSPVAYISPAMVLPSPEDVIQN